MYGGTVSQKYIADVLRTRAEANVMRQLALITALAISNLDLHAKSSGLLHRPDGYTELVPGYDLMPHGLREEPPRRNEHRPPTARTVASHCC